MQKVTVYQAYRRGLITHEKYLDYLKRKVKKDTFIELELMED